MNCPTRQSTRLLLPSETRPTLSGSPYPLSSTTALRPRDLPLLRRRPHPTLTRLFTLSILCSRSLPSHRIHLCRIAVLRLPLPIALFHHVHLLPLTRLTLQLALPLMLLTPLKTHLRCPHCRKVRHHLQHEHLTLAHIRALQRVKPTTSESKLYSNLLRITCNPPMATLSA